MRTRTTNERDGPLTTADTPSTTFPEAMQNGASAGPPAAAPAFTQVDTEPDERRLAIARALVRLLAATINESADPNRAREPSSVLRPTVHAAV